ncbi:signal peptidase II [Candidatus Woesearchaeota archaeon]|nr:signal peptidase II [Candidatus Woesearchaeota archaeon]
MNKRLIFFGTAALVFLLDRITKLLIVHNISPGTSVEVGPVSLVHILNTGTAFGLLKSAGLIFTVAALLVSIYLIVRHQNYDSRMQLPLGLVLGGALGNVVDRFVYGAVIDFIDVHFWPVFNVADSAITIAIVLFIIMELKKSK